MRTSERMAVDVGAVVVVVVAVGLALGKFAAAGEFDNYFDHADAESAWRCLGAHGGDCLDVSCNDDSSVVVVAAAEQLVVDGWPVVDKASGASEYVDSH